MKKPDFSKKLIEIRNAKGLTQEEVAEKSKINVRTIQRIESGKVKPRAFTVKTISETLGYDFFKASNTGYEVIHKNRHSKLKNHNSLWYIKDLFNLKTNAMKKISILSTTFLIIIFSSVFFTETSAQIDHNKSLVIQLNDDNSIKKIEAAFTNSLTLDSLILIKKELKSKGINVNYKRIEFDYQNKLQSIACEVDCNDGFSGSFTVGMLDTQNKEKRLGFYRDYSANSKNPFGLGLIK